MRFLTKCHTLIFVALVGQSEDNNNNESSSLGIFLLFEYLIPDTPLFQLTLVLTVLVANVQCTPFIFGLLGDDLDHLIS